MSIHTVHIFISHSWNYSEHYKKLEEWIFQKQWNAGQATIQFKNYSIPKNDPIHNAPTVNKLQEAIYNHIRYSHVIVIPNGMYAAYSKWIQKEIDGAEIYRKPILEVIPWGQERTADNVSNAATTSVGWSSDSVVTAIWDLYKKAFAVR